MRVVVGCAESAAVAGVVGVESSGYELTACAGVVVGDCGLGVAPWYDAAWVACEYGCSEVSVFLG